MELAIKETVSTLCLLTPRQMLKGTLLQVPLAGEKVGTYLAVYLIGFGRGDSGLTELSKKRE